MCKDTLLVSSPPLRPTIHLNLVSVAQRQLCGGAQCKQELPADHHEHVCVQASVCVSEAGRFHPSLSSSLLQHANVAQAKLLSVCSEWRMPGRDQDGASGF